MPRRPRISSEAGIYHFINRGDNKKDLFHREKDYKQYLSLMKEHSERLGIRIHHYCLMKNHTHILLKCPTVQTLSLFGHFLQRCYAYYYCKAHRWSEQVFRKRFISIPIDKDSYLLECGRYIERNPVRAKLVADPKDFAHSSYAFYALGTKNPLISPNPLYENMGSSGKTRMNAYRDYVSMGRPYEEIVDETLVPF